MKQNILFFSIIAMMTIAMTSCWEVPNPEVVYEEANLLGLWCEGSDPGIDIAPTAFVRFTNETDDTGEYKYGREWDESEDIFENDLQPYGNGWFKYKLVQNDLTEIHLMDNGGAELPKVYVVLKLNEHELVYQDNIGTTYYYRKVIENN